MEVGFEKKNKIDGFSYAKNIQKELSILVKALKNEYNLIPNIAIVLVGNNIASEIYVRNKIKLAKELNINITLKRFDEQILENELLQKIEKINQDKSIHGVIVQLPLPKHIDKDRILLKIAPEKDIDGLHPFNAGLLHSSKYVPYTIQEIVTNISTKSLNHLAKFSELGRTIPFIPCTPLGCLYLISQTLQKTNDKLIGKNAVVLGNSNLVSKPMARLLLQSGTTTTTLHSKSTNVDWYIENADIVVSATGKAQILNHIKKNAIFIDVGIRQNPFNNSGIVGDLEFEKIVKTNYITPVPRGVGPMTVISLMLNSVLASLKQLSHS